MEDGGEERREGCSALHPEFFSVPPAPPQNFDLWSLDAAHTHTHTHTHTHACTGWGCEVRLTTSVLSV